MSPLERAIVAGAVVLVSGLFGRLLQRVLLPRLARLAVIPYPIRAIDTTQEMPHSAEARE
jgi:hypothetical protein